MLQLNGPMGDFLRMMVDFLKGEIHFQFILARVLWELILGQTSKSGFKLKRFIVRHLLPKEYPEP